MTSNLGSHLIQESYEKLAGGSADRDEVLAKTRNNVFELLKKSIRPEFLNRVDEIIMFEPLTRQHVHAIVELQFNMVTKRLAEQGVRLSASPEAIDWLAQLGYDPIFGARPVKRVIQKQVLNELSKWILAGKIENAEEIVLDVFENKFVFRKKE